MIDAIQQVDKYCPGRTAADTATVGSTATVVLGRAAAPRAVPVKEMALTQEIAREVLQRIDRAICEAHSAPKEIANTVLPSPASDHLTYELARDGWLGWHLLRTPQPQRFTLVIAELAKRDGDLARTIVDGVMGITANVLVEDDVSFEVLTRSFNCLDACKRCLKGSLYSGDFARAFASLRELGETEPW